jgi:hypothetical protein
VYDGVGGDGVDGAGRDDDGACLGGEVVESGKAAFQNGGERMTAMRTYLRIMSNIHGVSPVMST